MWLIIAIFVILVLIVLFTVLYDNSQKLILIPDSTYEKNMDNFKHSNPLYINDQFKVVGIYRPQQRKWQQIDDMAELQSFLTLGQQIDISPELHSPNCSVFQVNQVHIIDDEKIYTPRRQSSQNCNLEYVLYNVKDKKVLSILPSKLYPCKINDDLFLTDLQELYYYDDSKIKKLEFTPLTEFQIIIPPVYVYKQILVIVTDKRDNHQKFLLMDDQWQPLVLSPPISFPKTPRSLKTYRQKLYLSFIGCTWVFDISSFYKQIINYGSYVYDIDFLIQEGFLTSPPKDKQEFRDALYHRRKNSVYLEYLKS